MERQGDTEPVRAEFDYRTQSLRYRLVQLKVRTPPEAIPKSDA
jgi:hypothetical protein